MRVIEPKQFKAIKKSRSASPKRYAVIGVLVLVVGAVGLYIANPPQRSKQAVAGDSIVTVVPPKKTLQNKPKTFDGNQFKDLFRQMLLTYPNTQPFPDSLHITGNDAADLQIRKIAEGRGFQLTRIPVTALVKTDEPRLKGESDDLLQPLAYQAWLDIKKAAAADNIPLELLSAYRSPEWQRSLFMARLGSSATPEQIAAGNGDDVVSRVLSMTSVPGYSRHHTGYTVDFWCEDGVGTFGNSSCYKWLNANNYLHAKESGWIPSYPEGADAQGPEPEPWEYVWVGRDVLFD